MVLNTCLCRVSFLHSCIHVFMYLVLPRLFALDALKQSDWLLRNRPTATQTGFTIFSVVTVVRRRWASQNIENFSVKRVKRTTERACSSVRVKAEALPSITTEHMIHIWGGHLPEAIWSAAIRLVPGASCSLGGRGAGASHHVCSSPSSRRTPP